jgi:lysylphosphatidylglycerol synthetase-like protein (DUF2156 family)
MFEKLSKYLKDLSILLVVFGLLRQLIYYTNFQIPIRMFMEWSELWLSISNDLIYIIPLAILSIIGFENISDNVKPASTVKNKLIKYIFLSLIVGTILAAVYYLWIANYYYNRIQMILAISLGVYFIALFTNHSKMITGKGFFGFSFGIMIFMLTLVTTLDIRSVQNGRYKGTVIETEKETYISNDTSYFIGKTKDFVFIYRPRDFSTIIIPSNEIIRIILKSK